MKKTMIAATLALSAFLAAPVIAQTTEPMRPTMAAPGASNQEPVSYSERGDWRASKLIGTKVTNAAGEKIGDINDLLIDKNQMLASAVIGVGGFLGMGERHAAFTFTTLQLTRDANNNPVVRADVTKEQIKAMPEWQWNPASGEWRTSKLMGAKVTNTSGETIGDISDLLINQDSKAAAAVIGVGGYLGLGERDAAIPFGSLQLTRDADRNPVVGVNLSKEQLKAMPEWKWQPATAN
jgi:sporulation protein YlmC with PRC-barrel domain